MRHTDNSAEAALPGQIGRSGSGAASPAPTVALARAGLAASKSVVAAAGFSASAASASGLNGPAGASADTPLLQHYGSAAARGPPLPPTSPLSLSDLRAGCLDSPSSTLDTSAPAAALARDSSQAGAQQLAIEHPQQPTVAPRLVAAAMPATETRSAPGPVVGSGAPGEPDEFAREEEEVVLRHRRLAQMSELSQSGGGSGCGGGDSDNGPTGLPVSARGSVDGGALTARGGSLWTRPQSRELREARARRDAERDFLEGADEESGGGSGDVDGWRCAVQKGDANNTATGVNTGGTVQPPQLSPPGSSARRHSRGGGPGNVSARSARGGGCALGEATPRSVTDGDNNTSICSSSCSGSARGPYNEAIIDPELALVS